ncbi:MAG: hypothetical protein RL109_1718, partial [Pseudomonadota bacterium]
MKDDSSRQSIASAKANIATIQAQNCGLHDFHLDDNKALASHAVD